MNNLNAGSPVTGSRFVGRKKEKEQILQLLSNGQNVVLIAPRRFGKTSLTLEIMNQLNKTKQYHAYIDIFSIPNMEVLSSTIVKEVLKNKKLANVFNKIKNSASSMISNAQFKTTVQNFEFLIDFADKDTDHWKLLENSINFIDRFAKKNNRHIFCFFDEFGDINKLDGNQIVKTFRANLQMHKNAIYLLSGSYESVMHSMFVNKSAPFYRFARIINLDFIAKEDFFNYYQKVISKEKIIFQDAYLSEILLFTKGHPYYSQLALQTIIIHYKIDGQFPSINGLKKELMSIERNYLEKVWEDIRNNKENLQTLIELVKSSKGIYSALKNKKVNVARAINSLERQGFLFKREKSGYELTDPLFEAWIVHNILK